MIKCFEILYQGITMYYELLMYCIVDKINTKYEEVNNKDKTKVAIPDNLCVLSLHCQVQRCLEVNVLQVLAIERNVVTVPYNLS